ncbi:MAG: helix-turn-helix transcriptional regulator, partial [Desulfatiglandales bacterium]
MMSKIGYRIKELRGQFGISQQRLADLLGVLRPTISQIENGERRVSADELIKLSEIFNLSVESLLDLRKEPEVILRESKKRKGQRPQIRINVPQKNLEKFKEVFIYILNKVGSKPNIEETVIYKLLYFIDKPHTSGYGNTVNQIGHVRADVFSYLAGKIRTGIVHRQDNPPDTQARVYGTSNALYR